MGATAALASAVFTVAACNGSSVGGSTPTSPTGMSSSVILNDDFGGRPLFPSSSWWNQDIGSAPVDAG